MELLAAMTNAPKFLNSKDIDADVLIIMGKLRNHIAYYYEHDPSTNLISQKYRWKINNTSLTDLQNPLLFFEVTLNNKTYEATVSKIENIPLKDKLVQLDVISVILFQFS
jgi:uncharacterized protein (DUF1919 family)